jgi:uncharacterized caspase-like protein
MIFSQRLILTWMCLLWLAVPALAETRVALVIGNSAYRNVVPLKNPKNDAMLMAETLRGLGFSLVGGGAQLDLDLATMSRKIADLGEMAKGADVALIYYSGHGVQVGGVDYLAPIDTHPTNVQDADSQMLSLGPMLDQMKGAKFKILMVDAGRDNPFASGGSRGGNEGSNRIEAPLGTLISFATQPGSVAMDGDGAVSPYTRALAGVIKRPGLDIFQAFNQVGLEVNRATGGMQQPWLSVAPIDGEFYFAGPPAGAAAPK